MGVETAPGVGGAVGVAVAAGLKVMQALLFGIAMAGLRLASLSRTRCSGASASGAMEGVANLVRLDGLAVPVGVHFGFDLLYFAPVVLATGAFPLTYISTTPAECCGRRLGPSELPVVACYHTTTIKTAAARRRKGRRGP